MNAFIEMVNPTLFPMSIFGAGSAPHMSNSFNICSAFVKLGPFVTS